MSGLFTVADVAAKLQLKPQPNGKFSGAPEGTGATKDGFVLCPEGNAFSNGGDKYTSAQVAELAGIDPGQYEPVANFRAARGTSNATSNGHPAPRAKVSSSNATPNGQETGTSSAANEASAPSSTPGSAPKSKTPAARGITPETLLDFGVELDTRGNWNYPTHFADGTPGRARIKNGRGTKPKYFWSKDDARPAPPLFGAEKLDGATDVHFVGGEPDVMAMAAAGVKAVATFGENQGHEAAARELKRLGVERVNIALDNDKAGHNGAAGMAKACEAVGIQSRALDVGGNEKDDVSDLWARCGFDAAKFRAALDALPDLQFEQPDPEPEKAPRFNLYTFAEMAVLPRPNWLIRGLVVEETTSVLSADSGSFKSFIALEMALCVATGTPFHGCEVKRGTVVYVAAEGFYTLFERATAWARRHGIELPTNFYILRAPVNVSDVSAVSDFVAQLTGISPDLIILDTLSQCAAGLNENSNDEMARFVAGMAQVGRELRAHVQTLHHNAKGSGQYRGAVAIKANVDTHISLERPENDTQNTVFVRCEKQRGKPFEPFALRGIEVVLPFVDEFGDEITSLVFELAADVAATARRDPKAEKKAETYAQIIAVLSELKADGGKVEKPDWQKAVIDRGICKRAYFYEASKELENAGKWFWWKGDCQINEPQSTESTQSTNPKMDSVDNGENGESTQSTESTPYGRVDSVDKTERDSPHFPHRADTAEKTTPDKTARKKKSSNAASEPYGAAPTEPNPGAANDSAPDDAADGDLF